MTRQLAIAIYAEGRTDERFLPIIIQRTASHILLQRAIATIEVLEPICLNAEPDTEGRDRRILSVARKAFGYHCLIVHSDADSRTIDNAIRDRYEPGKALVEGREEDVCKDLLPIIPVRMVEAWMMSDVEIFQDVVGTHLSAADLGFPNRPHQVETLLDPKNALDRALREVFTGRSSRKKAVLGEYYEPLARFIRLEMLERVPAFQRFIQDLSDTLVTLNFILRDR